MRTEFIEASTRYQARKVAPWAAVIARVCGGFRAFESVSDYSTWRKQL